MSESLTFIQVGAYVESLKLKSIAEWRKYCKYLSAEPRDIPSTPDKKV